LRSVLGGGLCATVLRSRTNEQLRRFLMSLMHIPPLSPVKVPSPSPLRTPMHNRAVIGKYAALRQYCRMPTSERGTDRAARRASRFIIQLGEELRRARGEAGLSQAALGARLGVSQSLIARIEAGGHRTLSIATAARLLACVGRDLSMRVYRGAGPIHDISQVRLLEDLKSRVPSGMRFRTEVPLGLSGDQRAWDAVVDGPGLAVAWECYTRLEDVQATERSLSLKQRDSAMPCLVLVLKDSRHNRAAVRSAPGLRRSFPLGTRAIFAALKCGEQPRSNGLIFG
jgi:transcriptional regulator with XRE-family HTH domain